MYFEEILLNGLKIPLLSPAADFYSPHKFLNSLLNMAGAILRRPFPSIWIIASFNPSKVRLTHPDEARCIDPDECHTILFSIFPDKQFYGIVPSVIVCSPHISSHGLSKMTRAADTKRLSSGLIYSLIYKSNYFCFVSIYCIRHYLV